MNDENIQFRGSFRTDSLKNCGYSLSDLYYFLRLVAKGDF